MTHVDSFDSRCTGKNVTPATVGNVNMIEEHDFSRIDAADHGILRIATLPSVSACRGPAALRRFVAQ